MRRKNNIPVTKTYHPVIYEGIPDYARGTQAHDEYWIEQVRRCLLGYQPPGGDFMPGRLYFYYNFCQIKIFQDDGREIYSHPGARVLDFDYAHLVEEAKRDRWGIIMPKCREKGNTFLQTLLVLLYEWTFFPGNEVALGTPSEEDMQKNRLALQSSYSRLPAEFRHNRLKENNQIWLAGQQITETIDGVAQTPVDEGFLSAIHFRDNLNKKADAFNSLRVAFAVIDETGMVKNCMDLYLRNEACFKQGTEMRGCPIFCGTSKAASVKDNDYERMWEASETLKLKRFFVPYQRCLHQFINYEDGTHDDEAALNFVMKEDEEKKAGLDEQDYIKYRQEYPIDIEDCWNKKTSGYLPQEIIRNNMRFLREHRDWNDKLQTLSSCYIGRLEWVDGIIGGRVEFIKDLAGPWLMFQKPVMNSEGYPIYKDLDISGVDSYNKEDSVESDSKGAIVVYRRFHERLPICEVPTMIYHNRPTHIEYIVEKDENGTVINREELVAKSIFYNEVHKQVCYTGGKALVEDTDEELFRFFRQRKASHTCLAKRHQSMLDSESKIVKKYGIPMTTGAISRGLELIDAYLRGHPNHIMFHKLLYELSKFGMTNTDLVSAFMIVKIYESYLDLGSKSMQKDERKKVENQHFGAQYERVNGILVRA